MNLLEPAELSLAGIPAPYVSLVISVFGVFFFAFLISQRFQLLRKSMPDPRFSEAGARLKHLLVYGVGQARQPRYFLAGVMHMLLFAGFCILSLRSLTLIGMGFVPGFHLPFMGGDLGFAYEVVKDYTVLVVLIVCVAAIVRRAAFEPERFKHPEGYEGHGAEAYIILGAVSALMITDMIFDGTALSAKSEAGSFLLFPASYIAGTLMWTLKMDTLNTLHAGSYWVHIFVFFGLLNYLPLSKHFHVITALPNVYFGKLKGGAVKPVRWGVDDWMALEECGVSKLEHFTWKHILDFYSCADCGRCSDNCPAATVGRALSPKMISIKARDYAYKRHPVFGSPPMDDGIEFTGGLITEEEIWACTTCGACEAECPIFIEYIDKIVDMRRYLVEQGRMPPSLQKPMQQIKKKGNAYGGVKTKRAAWTKALEGVEVKELNKGDSADVLFFVDSCGSFDPRIQEISKSFSRILTAAGTSFGILGKDETDSGNEIRRLGEEGLFEQVSQKNIEAFKERTFNDIVTFDPHAFNTIRNEYPVKFPVTHAAVLLARYLESGAIRLNGEYLAGRTVTYHDPCYLGRHNGIYEEPRAVLRGIPGIKYSEMTRSRSRSFCCSGGGLLIWYENEEEKERMGEVRVRMAVEAGAQVIVTACPFCLINLEDAVKTTGNEGKLEVIDLVELVDRSLEGKIR
ncbi:MAG: (Fe-S)-binding protein [Pseudomonadota bacterium]